MATPRDSRITSYFPGGGKPAGSKMAARTSKEADTSTNKPEPNAHPRSTTKRALSPAPAPPSKHAKPSTPATSISTTKQFSYNDLPGLWLTSPSPSPITPSPPPKTLHLTHHNADIFSHLAPNTLLLHACNTQGVWGAGIAKAFKQTYPRAYETHREFCVAQKKAGRDIVGTAQLIRTDERRGEDGHGRGGVWVACLFTSRLYGKRRDSQGDIVRNTVRAVEMVLELVEKAEHEGYEVGEGRMCKVNSGKFGVEWGVSEAALTGIHVREGWRGRIGVWSVE